MKVGMQLYCQSEEINEGKFEYVLEQTAKTGVDGLEAYSYYDVSPMLYRKAFNAAGIVCCGSHNHLSPLLNDLDHVMEYNYVLGNKNIICHYLLQEERGSLDKYLYTAEQFNIIADKLKKNGFNFLYHNHDFEFREEFNGIRAMDILMQNTDPYLVGMELHIGWLPTFGYDIVEYMKRFGRRIKILHMHNFKKGFDDPFDSAPAIQCAKELDVEWAVLENVYPAPIDYSRVAQDVAKVKKMILG